jgi:hypothetical protein
MVALVALASITVFEKNDPQVEEEFDSVARDPSSLPPSSERSHIEMRRIVYKMMRNETRAPENVWQDPLSFQGPACRPPAVRVGHSSTTFAFVMCAYIGSKVAYAHLLVLWSFPPLSSLLALLHDLDQTSLVVLLCSAFPRFGFQSRT